MKRNVVLVLDADADTARAVAVAAATGNCDLRFVQTSKEFFHFCSEDFENVTAIVLDVARGCMEWRSWKPWTRAKALRPSLLFPRSKNTAWARSCNDMARSPAWENL
jgi:hypothetical protein